MRNFNRSQHQIKPVKSLGQNFLTDQNIAKSIVELLEAESDDMLIEIGPGEGALTSILVETPASVQAVEFDRRAVEYLKTHYPQDLFPKFNLFGGDIRRFPLAEFASEHRSKTGKKPKIIGNIPYNITSDILFLLFDNASYLERAVITMQREVAQRLVANLRTKDYGILTIAASFVSHPRIAMSIAPECFFPKPKIHSSVVILDFSEQMLTPERFKKVMPIVRAGFNQRRKMLSNSLRSVLPTDEMLLSDIPTRYFNKRAEELTPNDFIYISDTIRAQIPTV
ncbi:MAG: ribosomal RNA small subunit methyltransferase A [Bacteroidetes bacterium]|nr:ribosomal RNA small subunit methyltransferase A [Bacteroidota bacterium]